MDLGLRGKKALVCAGSKGLGRACAYSLAREGVDVVIVARGAEALEQTAAEIRKLSAGRVDTVVADITTPQGREAALARCTQPDILVNNAGGPPAGDFREFTTEMWLAAVNRDREKPHGLPLPHHRAYGSRTRRFGRLSHRPIDTSEPVSAQPITEATSLAKPVAVSPGRVHYRYPKASMGSSLSIPSRGTVRTFDETRTVGACLFLHLSVSECLSSTTCIPSTMSSADFSTVFSANYSAPSFNTPKHRRDLPR